MACIVELVERTAAPGTRIPKPEARGAYVVKRWGCGQGERALVCTIPNHNNAMRPYEKQITESEWVRAYRRLAETGEFTRKWFRCAMPDCYTEGSCNFTTIGGVFVLLGVARYARRGAYVKT